MSNFKVEQMLLDCDAMLRDAKVHLLRAQARMKNSADKNQTELEFMVDSLVFLKL